MPNKFQNYLGELLEVALPFTLSNAHAVSIILRNLPSFIDKERDEFASGEVAIAYEVMRDIFGQDYIDSRRSSQYKRLCEHVIFMTAEQLRKHTDSQKVIDFIQGQSPDFVYTYSLSAAKHYIHDLFCGDND